MWKINFFSLLVLWIFTTMSLCFAFPLATGHISDRHVHQNCLLQRRQLCAWALPLRFFWCAVSGLTSHLMLWLHIQLCAEDLCSLGNRIVNSDWSHSLRLSPQCDLILELKICYVSFSSHMKIDFWRLQDKFWRVVNPIGMQHQVNRKCSFTYLIKSLKAQI